MYNREKFILLSIIVLIIMVMSNGFTIFCHELFEVQELVIPPELKTEGVFFEPSAVTRYEDKLIILNDEDENGVMYFYEADFSGNIKDKQPVEVGRNIKDFEAVTYSDEPGVFYLLLSTSYGRDITKGIFKLAFSDTGYSVTPLPEKVPEDATEDIQQNMIYDGFNRVLNAEELNIEGLGYYKGKYNEYLFFGLREPLVTNQTGVWRMDCDALEEGKIVTPTLWFSFTADPGTHKKHGISSIEYYPEHSAFFILTVYETDDDMGGALWIARAENPEDYNVDIPRYPLYRWEGVKPEGLTLIKDENGKDMLFIVFDNDENRTGIPGKFTILPLEELCL